MEQAAPSQDEPKVPIEMERVQFKWLLLANPNYFGNLPMSEWKPVAPMTGNTKYEELSCLGLNLNLNMLEATVQIKLPYGYGGGLCGAGSTEWVRFYVDYGGGWEDVGAVAFNIHDIPNEVDCAKHPDKPLTYVVTQQFDPKREYCGQPVLPKARAILSWQLEPLANQPNWPPVWGNVLERHIQIKPRSLWLKDIKPHLLKELVPGVNLALQPEYTLKMPEPPVLTLPELAEMYRPHGPEGRSGFDVPPHRFALPDLEPLLTEGALDQMAVAGKIAAYKELHIDWQQLVNLLKEQTKGNVTYEEIECLGLDYNREWLVATFRIKRPNGYSGGLCQKGSLEYVAFWVDWDNTCKWTYLNTLSVESHDIAGIPPDGLCYTLALPVNLQAERCSCEQPKIARVRAVLSWHTPPSTTDPNAIPYWGNRLDAHVQIRPGQPSTGCSNKLAAIGGIGVDDIQLTGVDRGLTKSSARFTLAYGAFADPYVPSRHCPFGGLVTMRGMPNLGCNYHIGVRKWGSGAGFTWLANTLWVVDAMGHGSWHAPIDPATGYFTYLDVAQSIDESLGYWSSSENGLWEILYEVVDVATSAVVISESYPIMIHDVTPQAKVTLDSGGCTLFKPGDPVNGKFVARADFPGHFVLRTLPISLAPPNPSPPPPPATTDATAPAPGDAWSLDTSTMPICGYVLQVAVWDRTVRNSVPGDHNYNESDVGFCLFK